MTHNGCKVKWKKPKKEKTSIEKFKFVWGGPAGTDDPQIRVLDNLPHYVAVRHGNRLECCNAVDSRT